MKIIVNGSLIDVDYIYRITEIENKDKYEIHFLNDKVMEVRISNETYSHLLKRPDNYSTFSMEEKREYMKKSGFNMGRTNQ